MGAHTNQKDQSMLSLIFNSDAEKTESIIEMIDGIEALASVLYQANTDRIPIENKHLVHISRMLECEIIKLRNQIVCSLEG